MFSNAFKKSLKFVPNWLEKLLYLALIKTKVSYTFGKLVPLKINMLNNYA